MKECIAKNSTPSQQNKPWFSDKFKDEIKTLKAALRKLTKQSPSNNIEQRFEEQLKWPKGNVGNNISRLNSSSKTKTICEMIRIISGKYQSISVRHITINNSTIIVKKAIRNILAVIFLTNSSNKNFLTTKEKAWKYKLNLKVWKNTMNYSLPLN